MKNAVISIMFLSLLFLSCKKESNPVNNSGDLTSVAGRIVNWRLGSGKQMSFGPLYTITSETGPVPIGYLYYKKTTISGQGDFRFEDLNQPADSLFSSGTQPLMNLGVLHDTSLFVHDYIAYMHYVFITGDSILGSVYYSNDSLGYLGFINKFSAVGTYSMLYEYVDRAIGVKAKVSQWQDGMFITWNTDLTFSKGWNQWYVRKTYQHNDTMTISLSNVVPAGSGNWYFINTYNSMPDKSGIRDKRMLYGMK